VQVWSTALMRLTLPAPIADHRPPAFPWMGVLAPVLAGTLLYLFTRSPLSFAFAALGPIMALAALIDGRRQVRRARRTDLRRRADELARLSRDVAELHERERWRRQTEVPRARVLIASGHTPPATGATGPLAVRLGQGDVPSGLELDATNPVDREIAAAANRLTHAPVIADAARGIGLVGADLLTRAAERSVTTQLRYLGASPSGLVHRGSSATSLHGRCAVIVEIAGPRHARFLRGGDGLAHGSFAPDLLAAAETPDSLTASAGAVPDSATLTLTGTPGPTGRLEANFVVTASGTQPIDLVHDGPHALVGGTTGSGKSELLLAWLLSLADGYSPDRLRMLLFDFKGGATFDAITGLPHVDGLVTDLDGAILDRAVSALQAELRRREAALRASGARTVDEHGALARLVIVVDEFAALVDTRGGLHEVFADIASRGRSLGIHLILCTQRPAGAVRDSLLANCALRVSLRVVDRADSVAVVGTGDAAAIPRTVPGRCVIALHGETPIAAQVATMAPDAMAEAIAAIASRGDVVASRTGWLPPLPSTIRLAEVTEEHAGEDMIVLGRADIPATGSQPVASWEPRRDGALAIHGAPGSGRTETARTIATQLGVPILEGAEDAAGERLWDAVMGVDRSPLVIDDLAEALGGLGPDHASTVIEQFAAMVRRRGNVVAVTIGSPGGPNLRPLSSALGARVLLRMANRDEHALAGGPLPLFDTGARPGAGVWQGHRVQIAVAAGRTRDWPRRSDETVPLRPGSVTAVVTTRPSTRIAGLRSRQDLTVLDARTVATAHLAGDPTSAVVIVGDPDSWQSMPALWPLLADNPVVYECSIGQYRAVARRRDLPPALADAPGRVWLARLEADVARSVIDWGGSN